MGRRKCNENKERVKDKSDKGQLVHERTQILQEVIGLRTAQSIIAVINISQISLSFYTGGLN